MSASKPWYRSVWRVVVLTLTTLYSFWYMATPRVGVYYSDKAAGQLDFIWDTQHSIYKGEIPPGGVTGGIGDIFPNDKFFMDFHWTASRKNNCIRINPKWPTTSIYINADGNVDITEGNGTDIERLTKCTWSTDTLQ